MQEHAASPPIALRQRVASDGDMELLRRVAAAVEHTGAIVGRSFDAGSRPADFNAIRQLVGENDARGEKPLKDALMQLVPSAGWSDEAAQGGLLPPGDWWVTDPCEGNINKVHGIPEFCTSATLVRDNQPILSAVHLPLAGVTYTAVAGGGATANGQPIKVSGKTAVSGAFVASCQNGPFEGREAATRLGHATTEMLVENVIVRVSPPPTLQLLAVASGRMDAFFLFGSERAGLLAGALIASEAGATVTDVRNQPWSLASETILVATPKLHVALSSLLVAVTKAT